MAGAQHHKKTRKAPVKAHIHNGLGWLLDGKHNEEATVGKVLNITYNQFTKGLSKVSDAINAASKNDLAVVKTKAEKIL